jgi:hypothetical protein
MSGPAPAQAAQAIAGLQAALKGLNAAAVFYSNVFGQWPRFNESVARILVTPLQAVEFDQLLDVSVLTTTVPGHE